MNSVTKAHSCRHHENNHKILIGPWFINSESIMIEFTQSSLFVNSKSTYKSEIIEFRY